jgi:hypothetical protein
MAVVDGDPAKGPAHAFLKFAPGFSAPRHFHVLDIRSQWDMVPVAPRK